MPVLHFPFPDVIAVTPISIPAANQTVVEGVCVQVGTGVIQSFQPEGLSFVRVGFTFRSNVEVLLASVLFGRGEFSNDQAGNFYTKADHVYLQTLQQSRRFFVYPLPGIHSEQPGKLEGKEFPFQIRLLPGTDETIFFLMKSDALPETALIERVDAFRSVVFFVFPCTQDNRPRIDAWQERAKKRPHPMLLTFDNGMRP